MDVAHAVQSSATRGHSRGYLVAALIAGLLLGFSAPAVAADVSVRRVQGDDRYATAAAISRETFPDGADAIVLARGDDFADALSAASLAGALNAPILLTRPTSVPEATLAELGRLQADSVAVIGGTSAVGTAVEDHLRGLDLTVERIAGVNRYATAAAVARTLGSHAGTLNGTPTVFLATGTGYADAVAAGALAYANRLPILLTRPDRLSPEAAAAIAEAEVPRVLILGGEHAVGSRVAEALTDVHVERLAGPDRTATAAVIARLARTLAGFGDDDIVVARGDDYADALAAAALGGKALAPILLTNSNDTVGRPTRQALRTLSPHTTKATLLGGPAALSEGVAMSVKGVLAEESEAALVYRSNTDLVVAGFDNDILLTVDQPNTVALNNGTLAHERQWQEPEPDPDDFFEGQHLDVQLRDATTGSLRGVIPNAWNPLLADDGETVVFMPDPMGRRDPYGTSIFLRAPSGDIRRLVQFAGEPGFPGIPTGHDEPSIIVNMAMDQRAQQVAVAFGAPPNEPGATTALYDVWVIDTTTDAVRRITDDHRSWQPDISPDGTRLLFVRDHEVCGQEGYFAGHLEILDLPDGAAQRLLSTSCDAFFYLPRWVGNDTIVAHRISVAEVGTHRELVAIDAATGEQTVLVPDLGPPGSVNLSVSPESGLLTYQTPDQQADSLSRFTVLELDSGVTLEFPGQGPELDGDNHT